MVENEKKLTNEEIEQAIKNRDAIWAIEGMYFTNEERELARKYLSGEISFEELKELMLK